MPNLRVLQVSDLHAGTREEPEVEGDLRTLGAAVDPELNLATGDLSHRNKREQHERAASLLHSLERPLLVIPGNHDIPRWPPSRLTNTFDEFERHWPGDCTGSRRHRGRRPTHAGISAGRLR